MANALIPELAVSDWHISRSFYCELIGFTLSYARAEEGFAFLRLGDAELMIDQIGLGRTFAVAGAAFDYPLGRGINLQIRVSDVEVILQRLAAAGITPYLPLEEHWYRRGADEVGNRQFAVADPDGYLLRLYQDLGERPFSRPHLGPASPACTGAGA
ncbi:Uncharacterized conserved protein PhnB, glyoxalase superfamily [Pseudomonas flavescens]|uniref:Bleomycin resistance protein n=1 Tax=Phytopseudomonas flavescens TaxID=29435 RepID=A0A1G8KBE6_9GAMM|nr:VOC family protein [Pseudomonas flavescens]SDI40713.1 Uncharacterized conserved protein PhnB, glyoxalase superfamily [Pseudomonas flavescens]